MCFTTLYPRPIDKINKLLKSVEKKISTLIAAPVDERDELTLIMSRNERNYLKEELRTANWLNKPYDMELSVKGPIVSNRSIPLNFFSSLTSIIQNIYLEISYDPFYFNERSVGFLNKCDGDDQFHLKSVTGSSIALLLPIKSEVILSPQSELYAQLSYEEGFFMHLLTIGHLDKIYIEDMSPKLLRYYIQLLKLLVKTGATLSTRTKFHPFKISFTPKWARIRLKKINKVLDKKN